MLFEQGSWPLFLRLRQVQTDLAVPSDLPN